MTWKYSLWADNVAIRRCFTVFCIYNKQCSVYILYDKHAYETHPHRLSYTLRHNHYYRRVAWTASIAFFSSLPLHPYFYLPFSLTKPFSLYFSLTSTLSSSPTSTAPLNGSRIKARQRSVARQMHDKLNLHSPDSTATN